MTHFQVIILGAGINGLATAYHLARLGCRRVAVVDQFPFLHSRGSSHGATRITRSTYHSADYVRLMQHVFSQEMPRWERDLGGPLSIPTRGCFFGPADGAFPSYRASVASFGELIEEISAAEARRRFPQMTFAEAESVLVDRSCAVLLAESIRQRLLAYLGNENVSLIDRRPITQIVSNTSPIELKSAGGSLFADQLIVTAGSWVGSLFPSIAGSFAVVRQTVGYFPVSGEAIDYRPGRFPVWVSIGRDGDDYYGLPQLENEGIKFARHVRSGTADDPNALPANPDPHEVNRLIDFGGRHFTSTLGTPRIDHCLYTNSADEDFVIDHHPDDSRIQIGSACSGHGFKFAPLTGRILAERALLGKSFLDDDTDIVRRFSLRKTTRYSSKN